MDIWIALIAGIIIGWLAEWIIDWYFWRRGIEAFYATEADLRRQLQIAEQKIALLTAEDNGVRSGSGPAQATDEAARPKPEPSTGRSTSSPQAAKPVSEDVGHAANKRG